MTNGGHYNTFHNVRTSDNVKIGLSILSREADKTTDSFMMKLAWLLGYYSHVMTDVVVHPVVYKIVGGPYSTHKSAHTHCELCQDSILCHILENKEITDINYLEPLKECSGTSKFTLDPSQPRVQILNKIVADFWKAILKENYPAEFKADPPDVDSWHRAFLELMPVAQKGRYLFGKLPSDLSLTYTRFRDIEQDDKDKTFFKITLPDNTVGNYQSIIFKEAINTVSTGWEGLLNGLADTTALVAFNQTLKNWCLDDGTIDGTKFALWNGTTAIV